MSNFQIFTAGALSIIAICLMIYAINLYPKHQEDVKNPRESAHTSFIELVKPIPLSTRYNIDWSLNDALKYKWLSLNKGEKIRYKVQNYTNISEGAYIDVNDKESIIDAFTRTISLDEDY
jgi:hypothetical protein